MIPVEGKSSDGAVISGMLLDAGDSASELELLRTIAAGLGVAWGKDEFGWWAAVSNSPVSTFGSAAPVAEPEQRHALFREDDNGARFLIDTFASRAEAENRAAELALGGHKQHYFVEPVSS